MKRKGKKEVLETALSITEVFYIADSYPDFERTDTRDNIESQIFSLPVRHCLSTSVDGKGHFPCGMFLH